MVQHSAIAAALADQRRRALVAEAETARMVRAGRDGSTMWPASWFRARRHPAYRLSAAGWRACAPLALAEAPAGRAVTHALPVAG